MHLPPDGRVLGRVVTVANGAATVQGEARTSCREPQVILGSMRFPMGARAGGAVRLHHTPFTLNSSIAA
jgi:hypothetical protein